MTSISDAKAKVYPFLVAEGRAGQRIFYRDLWKMAGLNPGWRRYMGTVVGEISEEELVKGNPPLSAIVVRIVTGYPGGGFFGLPCTPPHLMRTKAQFSEALSNADKEYVRLQQEAVWKHWGNVS